MGTFQRRNIHQSPIAPQRIMGSIAAVIVLLTLTLTPSLMAQSPRPFRLARMTPLPIPMNPDFVLSKFAVLKPYQHRESGNGAFNMAVFNLQLPNISIFNQMAAVHQFVQKNEFTKADRMAHVLFWYAQLHDFPSMQLFFRHLLYLEREAQQRSEKLNHHK